MTHTPLIPARDWLTHYSRAWLSADVVAGLTAAAVVLPQAMAYASLANLRVEQGLYTPLITLPVYALLGVSRVLSVTVTSPIALLTVTAVRPLVAFGATGTNARAAATMALTVGTLLVLAGLLRLGFLSNFNSLATLTGFKFGTGWLIASSQLGKVMGISFQSSSFLRNNYTAFLQWPCDESANASRINRLSAMMLALARWAPRLPAALFVLKMKNLHVWRCMAISWITNTRLARAITRGRSVEEMVPPARFLRLIHRSWSGRCAHPGGSRVYRFDGAWRKGGK